MLFLLRLLGLFRVRLQFFSRFFNIFPGFCPKTPCFSRFSRSGPVFPGFPGFPGAVGTLNVTNLLLSASFVAEMAHLSGKCLTQHKPQHKLESGLFGQALESTHGIFARAILVSAQSKANKYEPGLTVQLEF